MLSVKHKVTNVTFKSLSYGKVNTLPTVFNNMYNKVWVVMRELKWYL